MTGGPSGEGQAHALCGATLGSLTSYDGERFSRLATHGYPPEYEALVRTPNKPLPYLQRLLEGARFVHDADVAATPSYLDDPFRRAAFEIVGIRTALFVPLRKDERLLGYISARDRARNGGSLQDGPIAPQHAGPLAAIGRPRVRYCQQP